MTQTLTIRRAHPDDLGPLDALFAASYPFLLKADYPPSVLVTALPLISRAQPGLLRSPTYFVAQGADGKVVGAGGWTLSAPGAGKRDKGVGHIRHVVTDHRRTRQGIGGAIMKTVLASAGNSGIRRLECLSTRTAVPFYRAVGFTLVEEVEIQLRPGIGFPAVALTLRLD